MKYLGSIAVVEDSRLHSVCFGDIRALDERMRCGGRDIRKL